MEYTADSVKEEENQGEIEMPFVSGTCHGYSTQKCHDCAFSKPGHSKSESDHRSKSATKLSGLMIFYILVMVVEVIGGFKANSLAVLADAAHMLTDVVGLLVSFCALWASGWQATSHYSFGFHRLEILGALLSVQLIWSVTGLLIYEAFNRLLHKTERVDGKIMFLVAAFGFLVNFVMFMWLGHDHLHHGCGHGSHKHGNDEHNAHEHDGEELHPLAANEDAEANQVSASPKKSKILNINLQGVYLHLLADMIQSVGVMIAGGIIWLKPKWIFMDLISTLMFSVLVLGTTLPLLKNVFCIVMEGAPREIDVDGLRDGLQLVKGVHEVHDLHVWAVTLGKVVLSCHVVAEPGVTSSEIRNNIRSYCEGYRIHHVTIQVDE